MPYILVPCCNSHGLVANSGSRTVPGQAHIPTCDPSRRTAGIVVVGPARQGSIEVPIGNGRRYRCTTDECVVYPHSQYIGREFELGLVGIAKYKRKITAGGVAFRGTEIKKTRSQHHGPQNAGHIVDKGFGGQRNALDVATR